MCSSLVSAHGCACFGSLMKNEVTACVVRLFRLMDQERGACVVRLFVSAHGSRTR